MILTIKLYNIILTTSNNPPLVLRRLLQRKRPGGEHCPTPRGPLHLSASTSSRSSPSTVSPNTSTGSQRRVQGSVVPGSAKFVSVNGNFVAPSQQQQQQLHQQQLGPSPSGWHRSSSAQEDNHENVIGEGQAGESMSMSQQASVRSVHLDPRMSWSH